MELSERLPRRYNKSPNDIFCLVKHHLCDEELQQLPLLVYPGDEKQVSIRGWRTAMADRGHLYDLDGDQKSDLLELAGAFQQYPQYERAVRYYKSLGGVTARLRLDVQDLAFISAGGSPHPGLALANLPPREPRAIPHNLQVRFRRQ